MRAFKALAATLAFFAAFAFIAYLVITGDMQVVLYSILAIFALNIFYLTFFAFYREFK